MLQRSSTFDGIAFVIQWRNTSFSLSLLWKRAKLSRLFRSVRSGAAVAKTHLSANVYGRHIQEVDLIFRQLWRFFLYYCGSQGISCVDVQSNAQAEQLPPPSRYCRSLGAERTNAREPRRLEKWEKKNPVSWKSTSLPCFLPQNLKPRHVSPTSASYLVGRGS